MPYNPRADAYFARNPIKWFRVKIWDFEVLVKAETRAQARYEAWLNFHGAYDVSFGDFCKQSSVKGADKDA